MCMKPIFLYGREHEAGLHTHNMKNAFEIYQAVDLFCCSAVPIEVSLLVGH